MFAVNANSPYKTLEDFIKAAKAQPGKLNIGTIAVGGTQNLGAELFKSLADVNVADRAVQAIRPTSWSALLRNDVQMLVEFPPAIKGQVDDGKLRVLATSGAEALAAHAGRADRRRKPACRATRSRRGTACSRPKGTPKEVVDTMNKAMREVLAMPDVKERFAKLGVDGEAEHAGRADGAAESRHQEVGRGDRRRPAFREEMNGQRGQ